MPEREDVFQKAMNEGHSAAWDQDWRKAAAEYRKALQELPDQPKSSRPQAVEVSVRLRAT